MASIRSEYSGSNRSVVKDLRQGDSFTHIEEEEKVAEPVMKEDLSQSTAIKESTITLMEKDMQNIINEFKDYKKQMSLQAPQPTKTVEAPKITEEELK